MEDRRKIKKEVEANLTEVKHALSILQDKFGNIKNVVCDFPNLHELIYVHCGCFFFYSQCFGNLASSLCYFRSNIYMQIPFKITTDLLT
jgi:hypothetical protein